MTAKTPKHGDLVAAVADLSPRKVEKFAIALGVPKNVVEESQINNPKDIDRVKLDALDWWIRNENASWEAIAKALEARGVDERNLAKRIRSSHGLIVPVEDDIDGSLMVQRNPIPLLQQKSLTPVSIADMQRSFAAVITKTMKSLESTTTTEEFAVTLLALGAYEPATKREQALLEDHEDEISDANSIPGIYKIIRHYMSFFNPELLGYIIELHGTQTNQIDFEEYMSKLNTFCQSIVVPPVNFSSGEESLSVERREKITVKLDLSDKRIERLRDVKSAIAKVLGVNKAALFIDSVKEGSIQIVFLVPQFVVQCLFPLSDVYVKAISSQIGAFELTIVGGDYVDFPFEETKCIPKVLQDDSIVLNVLLNCEHTKSSETKKVHFQSLPTTPLEIKKKIEEDFSIPSCVQTLHYQSMILKDSDQLQHTHFRSGDTFTVDYPIEAECEMIQNVIKWLKELCDLLESIEENIAFPGEENDLLMSNNYRKIENLMIEGEKGDFIKALSLTLFYPFGDTRKLMNKFYFQQEGGPDVLMKVYGILVSKEWGDLGIDKNFHIYLERKCSQAICNYAEIYSLRRPIVQLGGLEMSTTALLRRQLRGDGNTLDTNIYEAIGNAAYALANFSELPECQVPLAIRTDVIDQILAIATHPAYDCYTAKDSVVVIVNLTQSPETHPYIVTREIAEKLLEVCDQRRKMTIQRSTLSQQRKKKDLMIVNVLKYYASIALAQIGLGSPHLLFDSIPPHLLQQILDLMSEVLEVASPAEIRQYDESLWGTFLPYLQYLYKPLTVESVPRPAETSDGGDKTKLHISCCNVILYGLEAVFGQYVDEHLAFLVKEGLLYYTMCLPAVLPGECQPRARSLVNELGKHRQLQPPSLCTLAKAHIAKTFCGLQPVMEMNSIGEFLHKYFPTS